MIARWICRRKGHRIHPDPGDFVLLCTRCGACVDMHELLRAAKANRATLPGLTTPDA